MHLSHVRMPTFGRERKENTQGPEATACRLPCGWHMAKEVEEAAAGNDPLWAPGRHKSCSESHNPKGKKLEVPIGGPCPWWLPGGYVGSGGGVWLWPVLEPSSSRV